MAAATSILVVFPEVNGPDVSAGVFPQPPLMVATRTYNIPAGERVVSATISGYWGTSVQFKSTAGVDVLANGVLVAQCVKDEVGCYLVENGPTPWTHTFTEAEMQVLNGGSATLTAVQTSEIFVRLGVTTLVITTAPPPAVPALSPPTLAALLLAMVAAGLLALRRRVRA